MQQSTCYQKRDHDKLGSRERDELGLQSLSGGFRLRLQNQNLIDRPNTLQSQCDTTNNPRERKVNNSTINQRKEKVRKSLANE